jgi:hypothetical protein
LAGCVATSGIVQILKWPILYHGEIGVINGPFFDLMRAIGSSIGSDNDELLHAKYEIAHKRRAPDPRR